jgi:hypothetical protein
MKSKFGLVIIAMSLIQGCTAQVNIPAGKAGVVKSSRGIEPEVLKAGKHPIVANSELIVYDVSSEKLEFGFGVSFSDGAAGNLRLAFEVNPIVDSLSGFYRRYESIYVSPIVQQSTMHSVRMFLVLHKKADLTQRDFENQIIQLVTTNPLLVNYVKISSVEIVDFVL